MSDAHSSVVEGHIPHNCRILAFIYAKRHACMRTVAKIFHYT